MNEVCAAPSSVRLVEVAWDGIIPALQEKIASSGHHDHYRQAQSHHFTDFNTMAHR
jgi:hypothetical protein